MINIEPYTLSDKNYAKIIEGSDKVESLNFDRNQIGQSYWKREFDYTFGNGIEIGDSEVCPVCEKCDDETDDDDSDNNDFVTVVFKI